jgi:hypothetical protein
MASIQRASRDDVSNAAKDHKLYLTFEADQRTANKMLSATIAAYRHTEQAVRGRPDDQPIDDLFANGELPPDVSRRYGNSGTIRTLREDLDGADRRLQDAVIVYYVGAFERFLNGFCIEAGQILTTRDCDARGVLKRLNDDVEHQGDRWSINLWRAAEHLPEIKARLILSIPTHRPVRNAPPIWNCFTMTQMWVEIRNLIVHHDRRVHETFNNKFGKPWQVYRSSFENRPAKLTVGSELPLGYRNVTHCFTHVRRSVDELVKILCDEYDQVPLLPPGHPRG